MDNEFRIYRSLDAVGPEFGPCAITIGNFDGVHIGHQEILRHVTRAAREQGWKPSAMTFDPHPAKVLAPERAPQLLSTPEERCRWMREAGITQILIVPFDRQFSTWTAAEFAENILVRRLGARAVLVGANFRFGRGKGGDASSLRALGDTLGFRVEITPAVTYRSRIVSSSVVRNLVTCGNVSLAARMLSRCFALEGEVVSGYGIGSKVTVPTLNLKTAAETLPGRGVYVTRTRDLETGREWPAVTNVGVRPTFDGERLTIETFLLEPLEGQSPKRIRVEFLYRLRDEKKFENPAALKAQIIKDVGRAQAYLRRSNKWAATARPV